MNKALLPVLAAVLLAGCGSRLQSWKVDPLIKVFPDDTPGTNRTGDEVRLVARNGHGTVQVAVHSPAGISNLKATVEVKAPVVAQVRRVGYVAVGSNPPGTPYDEVIRPAPALYPDPLFETFPYELKPKRTESVWVTVYAPPDTSPGDYSGQLNFLSGDTQVASERFTVRVTKATVPREQTLKVTNWLTLGEEGLRAHFNLENDEAYWPLLANIGRVMADHKQNVIITPVTSLVGTPVEGGRIKYDFAKLDRWVETFRKSGVIGTIEGGHLLGRAIRLPDVDGGAVARH